MGVMQAVFEVTLTQIVCGECGGAYAIAEPFRARCQEAGKFWTCPYCKTVWGFGKGEIDKERERLAEERERHRTTLARLNEANIEKAALERKLKRVNRGVCPHCTRTFANVARHIKCKHPESA